jgi:hypothetical protein
MAQKSKVAAKDPNKKGGLYIEKKPAAFFQFVLTSFATVVFLFGGRLAFDAQYRWAGIFLCVSGVGCLMLAAFIHYRHIMFGKKLPAVAALLLFTSFIVATITLGLSQWWFKATKDNDSFNAIAVSALFGDTSNAPDKIPPLVTIAFIPGEFVLHPVSILLYMRITNKQNVPAVLNGISLETSVKGGWKSWQKLCPVDMRGAQLAWIDISQNGEATLFSADQNLEPKLIDKPLAPFETVAGWTAWECPRDIFCQPGIFRVGLGDAAGGMSWQQVPSPIDTPIGSTLNTPGLRTAGRINLLGGSRRVMQSCRR